jgi:hypothetical protein
VLGLGFWLLFEKEMRAEREKGWDEEMGKG